MISITKFGQTMDDYDGLPLYLRIPANKQDKIGVLGPNRHTMIDGC